jgi:hypothetical protein
MQWRGPDMGDDVTGEFVLGFCVEFKTFSFVLSRAPEQRGSYLGLFRESKGNLSLGPKNDAIMVGLRRILLSPFG